MPRPCDHPTGDPQPDVCRVCWHYVNTPGYRELYDGLARPPGRGRCRHLGEESGRVLCQSCGGGVHVKLFVCGAGHGQVSIAKAVPGHACCNGCPDHEETEGAGQG